MQNQHPSSILDGGMRAMLLDAPHMPLRLGLIPVPRPAKQEILIRVMACGVCRTDLHIADGKLLPQKTSLVMDYEVVGHVADKGERVHGFSIGDRVGVPWLGGSYRHCEFCGAQSGIGRTACRRIRRGGGIDAGDGRVAAVPTNLHAGDVNNYQLKDSGTVRTAHG